VTTSPLTGLLFASTTLALTSRLDVPSAGNGSELSVSVSDAGAPAAAARGEWPGDSRPISAPATAAATTNLARRRAGIEEDDLPLSPMAHPPVRFER